VLPIVFKEVLYFVDQVFFQRVSVVESGEESDPLAQILVLANLSKLFIV